MIPEDDMSEPRSRCGFGFFSWPALSGKRRRTCKRRTKHDGSGQQFSRRGFPQGLERRQSPLTPGGAIGRGALRGSLLVMVMALGRIAGRLHWPLRRRESGRFSERFARDCLGTKPKFWPVGGEISLFWWH